MSTNYRFGQFYLDTSSRNLFSEGKVTRLSPRACDILVLLIVNQGAVVQKTEILDSVWSDSFVEENNLAVHISALRFVLKERETNTKHIETVSGRGYRFLTPVLLADPGSLPIAAPAAAPENELRSIAVLPFLNKNDDPKIDYLADGITDHLISNLSRISTLKVISYSAISSYKYDQSNLQEIGFLLGVESILVGSIIGVDDILEIRVELVKVRDLSQIWGTEYRRKVEQLYQTKTEISVALAEKLQLQLSRSEAKQISRHPADNIEAYNYYLRGRRLAELRSKDELFAAIGYFEEALRLDPKFAEAFAYIGFAYTYLALSFYMPISEAVSKADKAVAAALDLDSQLAEAYAVKGFLQLYQLNLSGARESLTKAVTLNPNSGIAHSIYSIYLVAAGNFEPALNHSYRFMELNPHGMASVALSTKLNMMGEFQRAIENSMEISELFHDNGVISFCLAFSYVHLRKFDMALKNVQLAIKKTASTEHRALGGYVKALAGKSDEAKNLIEDLIENYDTSPVDFVDIAVIYNALGDRDEAFNYLQKAFDFGMSHLFLLMVDPRFKTLRRDPRFTPFLQKIGLIF